MLIHADSRTNENTRKRLKWILRKCEGRYGPGSSGLGKRTLSGTSSKGNESEDFIIFRELFD